MTNQAQKLGIDISQIGQKSGFASAQEKIQEISQKKSDIDESKGKTLEEYSKVVTELNQSIKVMEMRILINTGQDRKQKLAPLIKELRNLRQQHQELEVRYLEKKALFDSATMGIQRQFLFTCVLMLAANKNEYNKNEQLWKPRLSGKKAGSITCIAWPTSWQHNY